MFFPMPIAPVCLPRTRVMWTRASMSKPHCSRAVCATKHSTGRVRSDYTPYDFVISVGGDGTFLEAARQITTQPIPWGQQRSRAQCWRFLSGHPR